MKKVFIILGVALSLASCFTPEKVTMAEDIVALENTKWQLVKPTDFEGTIEFNEDATRVSGFNGCNSYSADINIKNYQLEFGAFMTTRRYCSDKKDDLFMKALSKAQDYSLTGETLYLKNRGEKLLTFKEVSK